MTLTTHNKLLLRSAALVGFCLIASSLKAQTPAWFPLEVGNTWLYRPAPTNDAKITRQYQTVSVHGTENIAGRDYFNVTYFGREILLRPEPSDGSVFLYDRTSGAEQPWILFGLPVGGTFQTAINPCPTTGEIAARDVTVTTPAGQFNNALQVNFSPSCADVGVLRQFYAPYIGLLSDEETSFAGALKYELVYYHVGSSTGAAQELSFNVAIDSPRYPVGGTLQARLTLRSTNPNPIQLHFPSGQSFDLKILDDKGNEVYLWSKGRVFTLIIRDESFGPGERTYGVIAPLEGLTPGHYTAQAYLTTNPVMFVGQVAFDIDSDQQTSTKFSQDGVVKGTASPVIGK